MDLSEVRPGSATRHPWELARARAIFDILRCRGSFSSILDYGCGDGFTGRELQKAFAASELVGVDTELSESACRVESVAEGRHELTRDESRLGDRRFDLLLLCDVIEHVPDDREFLRGVVQRRLRSQGLALITVPAFQALFSEHDRALRHYRRYSQATLEDVVRGAGLQILQGGYLFSSLLLPRLISKFRDAVRPATHHGIGAWQGGPFATKWLLRALALDNAALLRANRLGVNIPGLSAWALAKTP